MLFSEYCKLRCKHGGISKKELGILGIDNKKGWMKRYANLEIEDKTLHRLVSSVVSNRGVSGRVKSNLLEIQKHYVITDDQMVYLMRSEVGNLKIGISKDPISRARDITNASGLVVECIAYWKVEQVAARQVEVSLHKAFKRHRIQGEWFLPHFQVHHLENEMTCIYTRLFYNEQAASKIDVYQPTSIRNKRVDIGGIEFSFTKIRHETEKALLIENGEELFWIAKSRVKEVSDEHGTITCMYGTTKIDVTQ